jgi:acetyl-CoA carboxylase carboxyltransferase component
MFYARRLLLPKKVILCCSFSLRFSSTVAAFEKYPARYSAKLNAKQLILNVRVTGGEAKAVALHLKRGKMLVRDRVTALLDPGTSFLELSPLADEAK